MAKTIFKYVAEEEREDIIEETDKYKETQEVEGESEQTKFYEVTTLSTNSQSEK